MPKIAKLILLVALAMSIFIPGTNQAIASGGIWKIKASMPSAWHCLAAGVVNGVLYALGGRGNSTGDLAMVEAYNPRDRHVDDQSSCLPRGLIFLLG